MGWCARSFLWGYGFLEGFDLAVKTGLGESLLWRQSHVSHSSAEGSVQDLVLRDAPRSHQFTPLPCLRVQALGAGEEKVRCVKGLSF